MRQPFPEVGAWPLADIWRERPARDQLDRHRLALFLLISLILHILTAAVTLGFSYLQTGGGGGAYGEQVFMVGLIEGTGESPLDSAAPEEVTEATEEAIPAETAEEVTETVTEEITEEAASEIIEEPAVQPEPEAFSVLPEPIPAPPPPPKAVESQPKKPSRPAPSGQAGAGSSGAGSSGSSGSSGSGSSGGGDSAGYLKGHYEYIKKRIGQHLVYSPQAKRMGIQGVVTVAFVIEKDGRARDIAVRKTSGHESLDESALKAVRNASPFPPPPDAARIVIPISFSLK
jgi:TonB family protein